MGTTARTPRRRIASAGLVAFAVAVLAAPQAPPADAAAADTGGSTVEPTYDVVVETNIYVEMDDGVRVVLDAHRPDVEEGATFPCLVEMTPYHKEGRAAEGSDYFVPRGFVLIEVDARGTGGSEGTYDYVFSPREQQDGAAIVEWAATEYPWCNGNVGLFGGSYSGIIQYLIAAQQPPHLKAIAPQRALTDLYRDIVRHGGILNGTFVALWSSAAESLNARGPDPATGPDPMTAVGVYADHASSERLYLQYFNEPYDTEIYRQSSLWWRMDQLQVPTLHIAGWYDAFTRGQLLGFQEALALEREGVVAGPHHLIVGPWNHAETHAVYYEEQGRMLLDWYRYWLDDGPRPAFMDGPRVNWFAMDETRVAPDAGEWRTSDTWPPEDATQVQFFLRDGELLSTEPPADDEVSVTYDYVTHANAGEFPSRWDNAVPAVPQNDSDQSIDEWRGLVWSTEPLDDDLVVAGPITLHLEAATEPLGQPTPLDVTELGALVGQPGLGQFTPPYHDTDWIVKVAEVTPDGTSTLITSGFLRASHRELDASRTTTTDVGLLDPFPLHTEESLSPPTPGEVLGYDIEVWPTGKRFRAGNQLRIALYSADTPEHLPLLVPARNTVVSTASQPSHLTLTVAPAEDEPEAAPPVTDDGDPDEPTTVADDAAEPELAATGGGLPAVAVALMLLAGVLGWHRPRSRS